LRAIGCGSNPPPSCASSPDVERGFCGRCGSYLFWRQAQDPMIWVALGALDAPPIASITRHAYVADKPDWYEIHDSLPQFQQSDGEG
jgi:hypothetical protein